MDLNAWLILGLFVVTALATAGVFSVDTPDVNRSYRPYILKGREWPYVIAPSVVFMLFFGGVLITRGFWQLAAGAFLSGLVFGGGIFFLLTRRVLH